MSEGKNTIHPDAPKTIQKPLFSEIGVTGLRQSSGGIYEEFIPRLQWPKAGDIYQEMSSNDPVITAILLCSRQLIRNVSWTVRAASSSKADEEAAKFLNECMNDMSTPWSDLIDDITTFFEYGFSYHEIVYKKREGTNKNPQKNSHYNDGRIGWRKIAGRAQRTMSRWEFDATGGIQGMWQFGEKDEILIPITKALLFKTTSHKGNPEGRSFLRGAYRPWYFKKHIEEIEGIGIERDLAGLPVVNVPEGIDLFNDNDPNAVEAKNAALAMVTSIRRDRNEGVVMPAGWELKLLSSGSSRQFDTNAVINRYDQRIAITMLADIVMLGSDKVGSFALAKVKQSMLAASLGALLKSIAEVFNRHAIPRLFSYNFFPEITGLPQLEVGEVVAPDLAELGTYIKALSGSNMPIFPDVDTENYLRSVAGLPLIDEASKERQIQVNGMQKSAEQSTPDEQEKQSDEEGGEDDAET